MVLGRLPEELSQQQAGGQERERKRRRRNVGTLRLLSLSMLPQLWMSHGLMVGWGSPGSCSQLCWVLGMRFCPSALGCPTDVAEQTAPGQG